MGGKKPKKAPVWLSEVPLLFFRIILPSMLVDEPGQSLAPVL